jgi:hypothetical protein
LESSNVRLLKKSRSCSSVVGTNSSGKLPPSLNSSISLGLVNNFLTLIICSSLAPFLAALANAC